MVIIILIILGLCLGSFVNALVWRVHEQNKGQRAKSKEFSILGGRSMCSNCKHELAPVDLIPVFSWLWLRGKCRYCKKPIDDNPITELVTPLLFLVSYIFWPYELFGLGLALLLFWLVFLVGFVALGAYDIKWMILPDKIIKPLLLVALAQSAVVLRYEGSFDQFLSIAFSFLIGGGIFYVLFQISGGKWIGGGDVKLGALIGLVLGDSLLVILSIFTASVAGTLIIIPLLLGGKLKKSSKIPFGPLLIFGAIVARLFGLTIINWYKSKFLIY